jgi:D-glycero-D-manno-heptose 1,7-bisphosphate phosphatase
MNKALFLDRDGTLIEHKPYLHKPEEVVLLAGTADALRRAREAGYLLFLFTNQSGVGRGYFTCDDVHRVHARLVELLGLGADVFLETCVAPEHPDTPSLYRKPSPRFILEMIDKHRLQADCCWMIGDAPSDWESGRLAAINSISLAKDPMRKAPVPLGAFGPLWFPDLGAAVHAILQHSNLAGAP